MVVEPKTASEPHPRTEAERSLSHRLHQHILLRIFQRILQRVLQRGGAIPVRDRNTPARERGFMHTHSLLAV